MAATVFLCERNGSVPGNISINTAGINWRRTDNSNATSSVNDALFTNTHSFEKYNHLHFTGNFTYLANVKLTNNTTLDNNLQLRVSASATSSNDCVAYAKPINTASSVATNNFSNANASINLLVGAAVDRDPASPTNKNIAASNSAGGLYSNYFVTQLYVGPNASAGAIAPVNLLLTYDEN